MKRKSKVSYNSDNEISWKAKSSRASIREFGSIVLPRTTRDFRPS